MSEQIPAWMDAVGPGWHPILRRLHEQILPIAPDYVVAQVKEKFGGLRVYVEPEPAPVFELIHAAEAESLSVCETCGQPGTQQPGYWIRTRCSEHAEERR